MRIADDVFKPTQVGFFTPIALGLHQEVKGSEEGGLSC